MRISLRDRAMGWAGNIIRPIVYFILILPALIVVITSFTAGNTLNFPPEGFSLRWYHAALSGGVFVPSLWMSLKLACLTMVLAVAIGMSASFAMDRFEFRGKGLFRTLTLSPLIVPMVVIGLGLLQFMASLGWTQSLWRLAIGHILITIPYVVRTLSASLVLLDRNLEQAAMNLRASPTKVLFRITIPLLAPAVVASAVFVFVTSFGNITLSVFLGIPNQTTLPVAIFTYLEQNYDPALAAISTIVIVLTAGILTLVGRLVGLEKIK